MRAQPWQALGEVTPVRPLKRAFAVVRAGGGDVRAERKARQLTQQQLAFESALSLTYVGEIERGQRMVSLDTLLRLATALKMTAAELLSRAKI